MAGFTHSVCSHFFLVSLSNTQNVITKTDFFLIRFFFSLVNIYLAYSIHSFIHSRSFVLSRVRLFKHKMWKCFVSIIQTNWKPLWSNRRSFVSNKPNFRVMFFFTFIFWFLWICIVTHLMTVLLCFYFFSKLLFLISSKIINECIDFSVILVCWISKQNSKSMGCYSYRNWSNLRI